tara:strand:- start:79 stop:306 length:228 start_codon:yes stop_codon:yes gene_type:complete
LTSAVLKNLTGVVGVAFVEFLAEDNLGLSGELGLFYVFEVNVGAKVEDKKGEYCFERAVYIFKVFEVLGALDGKE